MSQDGGILSGYQKFQKVETEKENTEKSEEKETQICTKEKTGKSILATFAIVGVLGRARIFPESIYARDYFW